MPSRRSLRRTLSAISHPTIFRIGIRNQKQIVKCILDQEAIYMLCRLPTTGLCHQARSLSVDPDRPSFRATSEKVVLVLRTRGRIRRLCLFTISNRRSRPMSRQNSLRNLSFIFLTPSAGRSSRIERTHSRMRSSSMASLNDLLKKAYHACLVTPSNPHASLTLRSRDTRKRTATW